MQTRKQELTEKEYSSLTEDEKRFYRRNITRKGNYSLNIAAKNVGVKNFDKFHNAGYRGLYNGETAKDIANRKGISDKEKRLISNLIYYTGILVNKSLLDSCDYIKVILRRYKDTPINTFNSIYM